MSNKIIAVTFVSENMCDYRVAANELGHFAMKDLARGARRVGDCIETMATCTGVTVEIPRSANIILGAPYGEYGTMFNLLDQDHCITQVILHYEDETCESVWVPYVDDESEFTNLCMKTRLTEDGNLQMIIDPDYSIDDIFGCDCATCCGCCTATTKEDADDSSVIIIEYATCDEAEEKG